MEANGPVTTPGRLVAVCAEITRLEEPHTREGRPQMLHRRISTTLQKAIERLVMIEDQTDFCGECRALRALLQRLFRHLSGRDVASDGLDANHAAIHKTQPDVLAEPHLL